ncbi:hypothetical protein CGI91_20760 [Vibrio parahaemolyticus]|nr:hypothetical protein CGI91_20760 [Vibrio parahaemolyticus]
MFINAKCYPLIGNNRRRKTHPYPLNNSFMVQIFSSSLPSSAPTKGQFVSEICELVEIWSTLHCD